ncbi:MAG: CHASE2 domain-containing protein [Myxococcota bacterium]|nr:CHASE2 domain-containing protein [Myxococcota bacterium]
MKLPWWRRQDQGEECDSPASHLARSMAYESLVVVFTAVAAAVIAFLVSRGQVEDLYIKARGSAPTSGEVAVVTIGPEALYLWDPSQPQPEQTPRGLLTELVRSIEEAGASVIVLDVLMDAPDEPGLVPDPALWSPSTPVVVATRFVPTAPTAQRDFMPDKAAALSHPQIHAGFANLQTEQPWLFADGELVRHAPLVRQVASASLSPGTWPTNLLGADQQDDRLVPSMTLQAAMLHRGTSLADLSAVCPVTPGEPLRCTEGAQALGLPASPQPLHEGVLINFRGPEGHDGIPTVRAASLLRAASMRGLMESQGVPGPPADLPPDIREALAGKVVIVGRVDRIGQAHADRFVTPYSFPTLMRADMAGVRVQAQVIDTLLSGRHVRKPPRWPFWLLGIGLGAAVWWSSLKLRDDVHAFGWSAVSGLLLVLGVLVFRWSDGWSAPLGPPLAGVLLTLLAVHGYGWSVEESKRT